MDIHVDPMNRTGIELYREHPMEIRDICIGKESEKGKEIQFSINMRNTDYP